MEYYYRPTNSVLSSEEVLKTTGIDPEIVCSENLLTYGLFPILDEVKDGLLDNPVTEVTVKGSYGIRTNSSQPLPLSDAKLKLHSHLQTWLNAEVERLVTNTGYSSLILTFALTLEKPLHTVISCADKVRHKTKTVFRFLQQIEEATSVEQLKHLLSEFEQLTELHGDS